ncbi:hypothetical protein GCM10007973_18380 [Polymorphobacter multimanifer]|uniref:Putative phiE125 gp8 family phage protein n=1 Tax=Polymorphobacter multimanifer TaxID=1070431 RepID=A0A841LGN0_9SPHN|nr:head-tail connector protein [Polymorphobacter multimanifer]MBB6228352.1 putative phiE125 gp8 family phage protein [Polymorphobacter multimanifer]GGI82242.1 hypothetical protein GCM10007973_18380 [Polymorphobacter multimanifer]
MFVHMLLMLLQGSTTPPPDPEPDLLMPVSLAEAKAWLREDLDEHDALITALIGAAGSTIEQQTGVVTGGQRVAEFTYPTFGERLVLPRRPLIEVIGIDYDAMSDGAESTVEEGIWRVREFAGQPALLPMPGTSWPGAFVAPGAVRVVARVGYATRGDVPEALRQAALMLVGHWFHNREAASTGMQEVPLGARALMAPFRRGLIG